jgi:ribose transport system ATP-binding protein
MFSSLAALDNLLMPHFHALARGGIRNRKRERDAFARTADRLRVTPNDPQLPAQAFSGGNAQKIAVGRWLAEIDGEAQVTLLLLDEPTQGIDVGARRDLYRLLRAFVSGGDRAVVFATSDPEEMTLLADRYVVLHRGRMVLDGVVAGNEAELLAAAHGGHDSRN